MRQRALSLMEVMIALAIVSFGLLTMVGVYISGIRLMARGEKITVATEVARRFLEGTKAAGYDMLPDGTVIFDGRTPDPVDLKGFPPPPYPASGEYRLRVQVEQLDAKLKSVTVSVYYDGPSKVDLQTYFRP